LTDFCKNISDFEVCASVIEGNYILG